MTTATLRRVETPRGDYMTDELRAFLAAWGAANGWVTWTCTCGRTDEAPCASSAWRAFRVHHVTAHVPAGVQAQHVAVSCARAALEAAE